MCVCVWLGRGKGEGMKFTNPEDELDWEEEQKVEAGVHNRGLLV